MNSTEEARRHERRENRVQFAALQKIQHRPLPWNCLDPAGSGIAAEPIDNRMRLRQTTSIPANVFDPHSGLRQGRPRPNVSRILPAGNADPTALELFEPGHRAGAGCDDAAMTEATHQKIRNAESRYIPARTRRRITAEGNLTRLVARIVGKIFRQGSDAVNLHVDVVRTNVTEQQRCHIIPVAHRKTDRHLHRILQPSAGGSGADECSQNETNVHLTRSISTILSDIKKMTK